MSSSTRYTGMNSHRRGRIGIVFCLWPAMMFAADGAVRSQEPGALNPVARQTQSLLSMTLERPLFAPSRRKPAQPVPMARIEAAPPLPPLAPPSVTLLGVLKSANTTRAVLRASGTEKIARVRVGDDIGGWKVAEIAARNVILSLDDRTLAVPLFAGSDSGPAVDPQLAIRRPSHEQVPRNRD